MTGSYAGTSVSAPRLRDDTVAPFRSMPSTSGHVQAGPPRGGRGRRLTRRLLVLAMTAVPAFGLAAAAPPSDHLPGWHLVLSEDFDRNAPLGGFATEYPGWAGYDGARDTSRDLGRDPAA